MDLEEINEYLNFYDTHKTEPLDDIHFVCCPFNVAISISSRRMWELRKHYRIKEKIHCTNQSPVRRAHGPLEEETPAVSCGNLQMAFKNMFTLANGPEATYGAFIALIRHTLFKYCYNIRFNAIDVFENLDLRDTAFLLDYCAHYIFATTDLKQIVVEGEPFLRWSFYKCKRNNHHHCTCYCY